MKTGYRIKYFRKLRGISREELATSLGLSKFAIAKYEQNQRTPDLNTLQKISETLDIPFHVLSGSILNTFAVELDKSIKFQHDSFQTIADRLFVNPKDIENVYNGFLDIVPFEVLNKIAIAYKRNINQLINSSYDFFIINKPINNSSIFENNLDKLSDKDIEYLINEGYIKDGQLIPYAELDLKRRVLHYKNHTVCLPISFDEMKSKVDKMFPALQAEIEFLSNPNVQMVFNYSYEEFSKKGYDELLISSIERAIRKTIEDIETHLTNGDLFDGVSSWISNDSPLYEVIKKHREEI